MSNGNVIAANFGSVEEGANSIRMSAQSLMSMLSEFNGHVQSFVGQNWQGDANDAFAALQANWNSKVEELNGTLNQAANVVLRGNADLQAVDKQIASAFQA